MSRILADKLSVRLSFVFLNHFSFEIIQSTLKRQVDFTASNPNDINQTIVLIVDRREDAITPLLNQV